MCISPIETKSMFLSMEQDLQQINEIWKKTFYIWHGPRSFECTLVPPDKEQNNPSCCKGNLSKILGTWKSTAKFPPVPLWKRLQTMNLFCRGFPTNLFFFPQKKKKVNCFTVFSSKSHNQTFHFRLGSIPIEKFPIPTHVFMKQWSCIGWTCFDTKLNWHIKLSNTRQ